MVFKEHSEFTKMTKILSGEEKKKKQHLLNMITQWVYDAKGRDKDKLWFNEIIEVAKGQVGMESTHAWRNTKYAWLHRSQTTGFILEKDSPYNEIDELFVEALYSCL